MEKDCHLLRLKPRTSIICWKITSQVHILVMETSVLKHHPYISHVHKTRTTFEHTSKSSHMMLTYMNKSWLFSLILSDATCCRHKPHCHHHHKPHLKEEKIKTQTAINNLATSLLWVMGSSCHNYSQGLIISAISTLKREGFFKMRVTSIKMLCWGKKKDLKNVITWERRTIHS